MRSGRNSKRENENLVPPFAAQRLRLHMRLRLHLRLRLRLRLID